MPEFIRERSRSSWAGIVDVGKGPDGSRKEWWVTVKGSRKDAERRLAEVLAMVNNGVNAGPSVDTFGDFLEHGSGTAYLRV